MVDYDNMGPSLQLIGAHTLRNVNITGLSKGHISLLLETMVTWSGVLVVLYVLCLLI